MKPLPENILKRMVKADREKYVRGQLTMEEALDKWARDQEKKLHNLFINWLLLHELEYDHSRMDRKATIQKGRADFHIWKGRLHCFVEFKSEHGRLKPHQKEFVERQQAKGVPILVTTSFVEATRFVIAVFALEWIQTSLPVDGSSDRPCETTTGPKGPENLLLPMAFHTLRNPATDEARNLEGPADLP